MQKLPFLTNERLSRLIVSLMLCLGLLLPLMFTFGAGSAVMTAVITAVVLLALFTVVGSLKRGRLIVVILLALTALAQLFLPSFGLFGSAFEALKAVALYLNDVPSAAPLFAGDIALTLGVGLAVVCYGFTSRSVGFMPATVLVVLMLFGMWNLGQAEYLWYAAPALMALLLLVSQTSHEKANLFEVLPMAAAVVILALVILPAKPVTVEPLYKAAMRLKQTISDYLFFTEPRNVFTLGSYGYYPMGNGRLGGEAEPSDAPVMTVKTDRRVLLRAVVKDEYTGRSWRDTSSGRRYLYVSPRWASLRDSVFLQSMPSRAIRGASTMLDEYAVSVQMQNGAASTVFTPVFLRSISAQSDMVTYFNESSELFITRDLARGDRYTVFAPILEGGDSALGALIEAAPKGSDKYFTQAQQKYLRLPDHMEQKVFDDLQNIVAASATPYERACAIQRHLQRYYRYTLEPDEPPDNQDFVTYFLYVGKEGYCTYYASAMTVLCRMAGLPARYVEGFVATPGSDGFAYVTGKNAHAWTEVYFEGFGWVPFDPTPRQQEQNDPPPDEPEPTPTPTPTPPPENDEEPDPTPTPTPPENDNTPTPEPDVQDEPRPDFPWWILLLAAAVIAALIRVYLTAPDRVAQRRDSAAERMFVYGSAAYAVMLLVKRKPRPGETPLLFARRMDRQKAFGTPVLPLWRMLAMSNYSRQQPSDEHVARARDLFRKLYQKQRAFTRIRLRLWAAFGRGLYSCLDTKLVHEKSKSPFWTPEPKKNAKPKKKKGS